MRAVFLEVPKEILRARRRAGLDRFDEMWDGELHMVPMPAWQHGRLTLDLGHFFKQHWEQLGEGVLSLNPGVRRKGVRWVKVAGKRVPRNYRGPDIVFLCKGHEDRVQKGWVVGPADVVLEVRSPGDETYEKFRFFHELGIPEVVVIHRDTKAPEVYKRGVTQYDRVAPDSDGWVRSDVLDTSFRVERSPSGEVILRLRRVGDPAREGTA